MAFLLPPLLSTPTSRAPHQRCRTPRASLSYTELGRLQAVSRIAVGTWSWGNRLLYDYDPSRDAELEEAFIEAVTLGINLFDTADSYGTGDLNGRAEKLLGTFLQRHSSLCGDVKVATKYASYPWRLTRGSVRDAAARSAERLGRPADLGQIHWPAMKYAPWQERALWDGLADALQAGYCTNIGVSNYGPTSLRRIFNYLTEERQVPLSAVQVQTSLLSRVHVSPGGVADVARSLGVGVIGYSPLCLGVLSGKYSKSRQTRLKGPRGLLFDSLQPERLISTMEDIAARKGVSVAQIAIAWCLAKDVVTLVGARTREQCRDSIAAADVSLSTDDLEVLEVAASSSRDMIQNAFQTN